MLKGAAAVAFLSKSGLDRLVLKQVGVARHPCCTRSQSLTVVNVHLHGLRHALNVHACMWLCAPALSRTAALRVQEPLATAALLQSFVFSKCRPWQIWNLSNRRGDVALSRDDFYIAMYLVSLGQQGLIVSRDTFLEATGSHRQLPLPFFNGVALAAPSPAAGAPAATGPSPLPAAGAPGAYMYARVDVCVCVCVCLCARVHVSVACGFIACEGVRHTLRGVRSRSCTRGRLA